MSLQYHRSFQQHDEHAYWTKGTTSESHSPLRTQLPVNYVSVRTPLMEHTSSAIFIGCTHPTGSHVWSERLISSSLDAHPRVFINWNIPVINDLSAVPNMLYIDCLRTFILHVEGYVTNTIYFRDDSVAPLLLCPRVLYLLVLNTCSKLLTCH